MLCPRCGCFESLSQLVVVALVRRGLQNEEYTHESVAGAADDQGAIADKVNAADGVGVSRKGAHDAGSTDVPEEDGFIVGTADEHIAFGGKGNRVDVVVMAKKRHRVGSPL